MGLAFALAGCGGDSASSPAVIRVGNAPITREAVEHWTRAIARGVVPGVMHDETHGTPRERALAFLISSQWLRREADALGVSPSPGAVERVLDGRREANGAAEFEQSLRASGQTLEDAKLEVQSELASAAIRRQVIAQAPAVSEADVRSFYKDHRRLFLIPETRTVELLENLPSPAAARALVKRIGTGPEFSKKALHEQLQPINSGERFETDVEQATRAAFLAPVGVPSAPLSLNKRWAVFIVRKVKPATFKPLAMVHAAIAEHVMADRRNATLSAFTADYRKRWTARTNCRSGYVVQGCAQYKGPARPQPNPFPGE
jgi:hypothetical protein